MDDLLTEFLTETAENIDIIDVDVVRLEQDPNDKEVLGNIFRLVHTIKGTCGFLGLPRLELLAHSAENVFVKFRDGELEVTEGAVTMILESLDRIKLILAALEETGEEPEGRDNDLMVRLEAVANGETPAAAPAPTSDAAAQAVGETSEAAPEAETPETEIKAKNAVQTRSLFERIGGEAAVDAAVELFYNKVMADAGLAPFFESVDLTQQRDKLVAFLSVAFGGPSNYTGRGLAEAHAPLVAKGLNDAHYDRVVECLMEALIELNVDLPAIDEIVEIAESVRGDILSGGAAAAGDSESVVTQDVASTPVAASGDGQNDVKATTNSGKGLSVTQHAIRVDLSLLENLMTTVSELVLTRNQLMQILRKHDNSEFELPLQRLNQCTSELQADVMKTRMQPVGSAWSKLPRIVRDLSKDLGKKIELRMRGEETELDRQVLELIKDPLIHMVRNSADHGIEQPAVRRAAGKPEKGTIDLNAYHEGGQIVVEIKDDGKGIPVEKIKEKALKQGVISEADAADMTPAQIHKLIFLPGLSTAEKVTNVSGRGVGMDVVRTNIEKIGGTVEVTSSEGQGSTFTIKIPLTLAIVSALIIACGDERFAIPQLNVIELVHASARSEHKIEHINNASVLRLRDRLLPLVYLRNVLGLGGDDDDATAPKEDEGFVIVTQVGSYKFGIVVDQVFDAEEIVVKPVAPILKHLSIYSGDTILGDGSVIMILDPNGLAAQSSENVLDSNVNSEADSQSSTDALDREPMLLFRAGSDAPKAVPLALVARLEDFDIGTLEKTDHSCVVQYRGNLMPLTCLDDSYGFRSEGRQSVLVFTDQERNMGIAVDEILDIVEEVVNIELHSQTEGILGTAVIDGKATEIIDVSKFVTQAFYTPGLMGAADASAGSDEHRRLLLVDDSLFFRNMLMPLLQQAGYEVSAVADADSALALRDKGEMFDVIISDIEMPGMNGYDFARAVKADERWLDTPLVALSSHHDQRDLARGEEVGFLDYVSKANRNSLIDVLEQRLNRVGAAA